MIRRGDVRSSDGLGRYGRIPRNREPTPEYVRDIQRLAALTGAYVVQTNWPKNALNRPAESVEGGESTVAAPSGEVMFRLPRESSGLGIFVRYCQALRPGTNDR